MALLAAAACSDNDLSTIGGDDPDATVMPDGSQALLWHPRIGRRRRKVWIMVRRLHEAGRLGVDYPELFKTRSHRSYNSEEVPRRARSWVVFGQALPLIHLPGVPSDTGPAHLRSARGQL